MYPIIDGVWALSRNSSADEMVSFERYVLKPQRGAVTSDWPRLDARTIDQRHGGDWRRSIVRGQSSCTHGEHLSTNANYTFSEPLEVPNRLHLWRGDDVTDSWKLSYCIYKAPENRILDKPVKIPDVQPEWKPEPPPEFVRNVVGSSAGAGSGEYHIYRNIRKKESERLQYIEQKALREKRLKEFEEKIEQRKRLAEEKTSRKRAKRHTAKRAKAVNPRSIMRTPNTGKLKGREKKQNTLLSAAVNRPRPIVRDRFRVSSRPVLSVPQGWLKSPKG
ncbi:hypothetical protein M514_25696 [Trichuris suis]|uniref:Uncharacterized protein n=1 Tax=Trichuris suis TaxID=68888 RepID=A0A085MXZ8_9BILA|nr:hypothetical protein M514_25696 [Trichuris suis]